MRNLLEFLSKYYHWLLFAVLEVTSFVLLFQFNSYQGSVWFSSANTLVGKLYELDAYVESYFSLTKINKNLTLRNFYLERQVNQLSRLYADLTRDTTILERNELEFLSRYKLIPAKVVSNSVDRNDNLMTIDRGRKNNQLLIQPQYSPMPVGEQIAIIYCGTHGLMHDVPVESVRQCQDSFLDKLRTAHPEVIETLASGKIDDAVTSVIEKTMADIAGQYKS